MYDFRGQCHYDAKGGVNTTALVSNDGIYFGCSQGYAYAVDKDTMAAKTGFPVKLDAPAKSTPIFFNNGTSDFVVFMDTNGGIYFINPSNGNIAYKLSVSDYLSGSAVKGITQGLVLTHSGKMYKLNGSTSVDLIKLLPGPVYGSPVFGADGYSFASTQSGRVSLINISTGAETAYNQLTGSVLTPLVYDPVSAQLFVSGVGTANSTHLLLNGTDLTQSYSTASRPLVTYSGVTRTASGIIVVSDSGSIETYNQNAELISSIALNKRVYNSVAVDDYMAVYASDGNLYIYSPQVGITSPADGTDIDDMTTPQAIIGTAKRQGSGDFIDYDIYLMDKDGNKTTIESHNTEQKVNAELGSYNFSSLSDGIYKLVLFVRTTAGNITDYRYVSKGDYIYKSQIKDFVNPLRVRYDSDGNRFVLDEVSTEGDCSQRKKIKIYSPDNKLEGSFFVDCRDVDFAVEDNNKLYCINKEYYITRYIKQANGTWAAPEDRYISYRDQWAPSTMGFASISVKDGKIYSAVANFGGYCKLEIYDTDTTLWQNTTAGYTEPESLRWTNTYWWWRPMGIAVDSEKIYTAEYEARQSWAFNLTDYSTKINIGTPGADYDWSPGKIGMPQDICIGHGNMLYLTDITTDQKPGNRVQIFTKDGVYAGAIYDHNNSGDWPAYRNYPVSIASYNDDITICDKNGKRIVTFLIKLTTPAATPTGTVYTPTITPTNTPTNSPEFTATQTPDNMLYTDHFDDNDSSSWIKVNFNNRCFAFNETGTELKFSLLSTESPVGAITRNIGSSNVQLAARLRAKNSGSAIGLLVRNAGAATDYTNGIWVGLNNEGKFSISKNGSTSDTGRVVSVNSYDRDSYYNVYVITRGNVIDAYFYDEDGKACAGLSMNITEYSGNTYHGIVASGNTAAGTIIGEVDWIQIYDLSDGDIITVTVTPTLTLTATPTVTHTETYSATDTPTLSHTITQSPTLTHTITKTDTQTVTQTHTITETATMHNTFTATETYDGIERSATITGTNTETGTPTLTVTETITKTVTGTPTFTITPYPADMYVYDHYDDNNWIIFWDKLFGGDWDISETGTEITMTYEGESSLESFCLLNRGTAFSEGEVTGKVAVLTEGTQAGVSLKGGAQTNEGYAAVITYDGKFMIIKGDGTTLETADITGYTAGEYYIVQLSYETDGDITASLYEASGNFIMTLTDNDTTYQTATGAGLWVYKDYGYEDAVIKSDWIEAHTGHLGIYTATPTMTVTQTYSVTKTITGTCTETITGTTTDTATETVTETITQTFTETITETENKTNTQTATETTTGTVTQTATDSVTQTVTETATQIDTVTVTKTHSPTLTYTATSTVTCSATPMNTNSVTSTISTTGTQTSTVTQTCIITLTATMTNTASITATNTITKTCTITATITITLTYTSTTVPVIPLTPCWSVTPVATCSSYIGDQGMVYYDKTRNEVYFNSWGGNSIYRANAQLTPIAVITDQFRVIGAKPFAPDGNIYAPQGYPAGGNIKVYNPQLTPIATVAISIYTGSINWAQDGYGYIISGTNVVKVNASITPVATMPINPAPVAFVPATGRNLLYAGYHGNDGGNIKIFNLQMTPVATIQSPASGFQVVSITDDGHIIQTSRNNNWMKVFEPYPSLSQSLSWSITNPRGVDVDQQNNMYLFSNGYLKKHPACSTPTFTRTPTITPTRTPDEYGIMACKGSIDKIETEEISETNTYCYPNPCSNETTIRFSMNTQNNVNIKIFDLNGIEVWGKRINGNIIVMGINAVEWHCKNSSGKLVGNGVYNMVVDCGGKKIKKKIAVIR